MSWTLKSFMENGNFRDFSNGFAFLENLHVHEHVYEHGLTATERLTAKILLNADNGGNEHDSSKSAQETPPEIQRRIFWCF
jgi:hypothetical protein